MSFESEMEKNTPMNTTHIHRNKVGLNWPRGLRQPLTSTRNAGTVQGTVPAKKTQPKNHQGSWRSAMGVKKRAKCSRMKKNCRKSRSRCAASQCQGTVMAKNSGRPHRSCSLRQGEKSRI